MLASQAGGAVSVAQVNEVLAAGIQDITNAMVESFQLNDVLRMILETMFRALGFRRMVFCLRVRRAPTSHRPLLAWAKAAKPWCVP